MGGLGGKRRTRPLGDRVEAINWQRAMENALENEQLPLYIRISKGMQQLVRSGTLEEGQQLPTVRMLAEDLGLNNGTVARAYQKLEQEGWIITQTGRGTFIKLSSENAEALRPKEPWEQEIWQEEPVRGRPHGSQELINMAAATPSPDSFPIAYFKQAVNDVLDRDGGRVFSYHEAQGYYPLRDAVCTYMQGLHVTCLPEALQITTGAQQGIDLIAKALIRQGDRVYLERPSYSGAMASFTSRGAVLVDIPMDAQGMDPNALENLVRRKQPRLVYVMPNYQSPTGLCYSARRRQEIIHLAERYGFYLVEDDYLGELTFSAHDCCPMVSLDRQQRVIYVKSFSKLFMPGLRLGFILMPDAIREEIHKAKRYSDISTSGLSQRALDVYLRSGQWKQYLADLKRLYKPIHDRMAAALSRHDGLFYFHAPNGGLTFWVSYPSGGQPARTIAQRALTEGLRVTPGESFYSHHPEVNQFRLGYGDIDLGQIDRGVDQLAALISTR